MLRIRRAVLAVTCLCVVASSASAASYTTANFVVNARTPDIAEQVGRYAEQHRRDKAIEWLGHELPTWDRHCTIQVKVTMGGAGGATSFTFDNGRILKQQMTVEGPLARILDSVLPHEITHTVFAARFLRPLPRWADEGGAVLSEDFQELSRHDLLVRSVINNGRMIPLDRLFQLTEYPDDVMVLYAQGFSVAAYLVSINGRSPFLDFVWDGQQNGWQYAAYRHYGFRDIRELEERWIQWLVAGKGTGAAGPIVVAGVPQTKGASSAALAAANSTRATAPAASVVRGQNPEDPVPQRSTESASLASRQRRNAQPAAQPRPAADPWNADPEAVVTRPLARQPQAFPLPAANRSEPKSAEPTEETVASPKRPRRLIPIAVGRTRRGQSDGSLWDGIPKIPQSASANDR